MTDLRSPAAKPVRVLVVDDSAVVRGMMAKWLAADARISIDAYAVDGIQALKIAAGKPFDVCVLDIEMPHLDGLAVLPRLLALRPDLKVIMASTLSERGAAVTLQALALGAADFIPKPSATRLGSAETYGRELADKIVALGAAGRSYPSKAARSAGPVAPLKLAPAASRPVCRPEALVVASSTGGPQALRVLLQGLAAGWSAPVLIAQHMPAEFTRTLAAMLASGSGLDVREGVDGEPLSSRRVYVAPGGYHMRVRRAAAGGAISLDQEPPINWCRPSADPLFASAADLWGAAAVGVVLTGMGHDGRDGARALTARGGPILAQDEATSVVWGMPGAVAEAGLAAAVLPVSQIAPALLHMAAI